MICEPNKTEIGQFWRFKDTAIAQESSQKIFQLFLNYLSVDDFVGADMARKYLQMGYTRARRYANDKGGKKYDKANEYAQLSRGTGQLEKAKATSIFYDAYKKAETNPSYTYLKKGWKKRLGLRPKQPKSYLYFRLQSLVFKSNGLKKIRRFCIFDFIFQIIEK